MADRITVTLHHLVSLMDAYADEMLQTRHGVTFSQFQFLAAVADLQPVDITSLARCLFVTKAAVSKRVPSLVADGWIVAEGDPNHGRRVLLTLTPRALQLVVQAGGGLDDQFTSLFADPRLGADGIDVDVLNRQLETLMVLVTEKGIPQ
ncbi:MarR family winged helix-turn-helix transcriptional regulator [Microbacterium sp. SS28]|uniref:MarR family winged helix-turn-helix transcriptional regulator n=1 Tax=Microbacterium sp. SS28 TaxID=2919948 RepID=UPI001FA96D5E|nr:MarR family transcriptional regulator [Microbacterium sp. SS28]